MRDERIDSIDSIDPRRPALLRTALWMILALGPGLATAPAQEAATSGATTPATEAAPTTEAGAYETLAAIRRAYGALDHYRDHGEIERIVRSAAGQQGERFYFSTAYSRGQTHDDGAATGAATGDALIFRAVPAQDPSQERVLWLEAGQARAFDRGLDQIKPLGSLVAELAHGFGDGGLDALVVPAVLAGSEAGLEDPEGAAAEGIEPCYREEASADCRLIVLSRMAGDLEVRLWVGPEDHLLRRLEVRNQPLDAARPTVLWRVNHYLESLEPTDDADQLAFVPPTGARTVTDWETTGEDDPDRPIPDYAYVDEITVEIFTLPIRVVDRGGLPIPGLGPDDLEVSIGGEPIPVSDLDWFSPDPLDPGGATRAPDLAESSATRPTTTLAPLPNRPAGGLKILFVQTDFEPTRIRGHLRIRPLIEELVAAFHPDDRVAVMTFDSHLKLWLDFTRDRQAVDEILFEAIKPGGIPLPRRPRRGPSLLAHFDVEAARDVAEPEEALRMTGEALAHLRGEKEMIFVGWGLGLYRAGSVHMTPNFGDAIAALGRAQVTVFVLDVSQADWHALEVGLKSMAAATGGTYQSTFHFASQATHRLARTLRGHYVLTLDRGAHPGLEGPLRIRIPGRDAEVLYRPVVLR